MNLKPGCRVLGVPQAHLGCRDSCSLLGAAGPVSVGASGSPPSPPCGDPEDDLVTPRTNKDPPPPLKSHAVTFPLAPAPAAPAQDPARVLAAPWCCPWSGAGSPVPGHCSTARRIIRHEAVQRPITLGTSTALPRVRAGPGSGSWPQIPASAEVTPGATLCPCSPVLLSTQPLAEPACSGTSSSPPRHWDCGEETAPAPSGCQGDQTSLLPSQPGRTTPANFTPSRPSSGPLSMAPPGAERR